MASLFFAYFSYIIMRERYNRKGDYDEVWTIALVVETRNAVSIGDIATVKK